MIYKLKLDEEKSKHAGLAQQNDFSPTFWHKFVDDIVKAQQSLTLAQKRV
jgi:hypothetical protein